MKLTCSWGKYDGCYYGGCRSRACQQSNFWGVFHEADLVTAPANILRRIYRNKAKDLAAGKQPEGLRIDEGSWRILELTEQYCFYEDWSNGEVHRTNLDGTQDIVIEGADSVKVLDEQMYSEGVRGFAGVKVKF